MFSYKQTKRAIDVFCATAGMVTLSPLLLLVFLVNSIDQKGKPLFKQVRMGKDGELFTIYKFRSMKDLYDNKGDLLPDQERKTKLGTLLRKTAIDELPQLFNIVKNDMSIVGPRPLIHFNSNDLNRPLVKKRQSVKPGVFSKSYAQQISSETSGEMTLECEESYIKNINLKEDVHIILKCLKNMAIHGHDIRVTNTPNNTENLRPAP